MKMYDCMALGYDFAEKWIGKIKYGNSIPQLRRELMQMLDKTIIGQSCMKIQNRIVV